MRLTTPLQGYRFWYCLLIHLQLEQPIELVATDLFLTVFSLTVCLQLAAYDEHVFIWADLAQLCCICPVKGVLGLVHVHQHLDCAQKYSTTGVLQQGSLSWGFHAYALWLSNVCCCMWMWCWLPFLDIMLR